ncbi:ATP-binding protein [Leptospira johnsonii]|uniref:Transcriptional regulator n=1 Tax=Leptospira johnsonii TaxID=1917820 RepID=A0A2P2CZV2_9LEPT|nr:ATP-binding protein [Leptospira johnsonii]GBF37932.1 transcriptional regulator [Leptospira johnsonii]
MKTLELSERDAIELCKRQESHFHDNKSKLIAPAKLEKIAVAFANADGGEICIGIKDEKEEEDVEKRWDGFNKIEAMNSYLQVLFNLNPNIDLKYNILKCNARPGYILSILVEKGANVHKTSDGSVYQRYGAQCLPIKDPQKISELSFAKGASSYEDAVVKAVEPDQIVDSKELKSFLTSYSPVTDPLDFCVNQNLLSYKEWEPRVAAILLFHAVPYAVLPKKCSLKISRYETKEDDPERDHLKDQFSLEGPLYLLINMAIKKVTEILSNVSVLTPKGLKKISYPQEAIWETVVNAFIHRDYSISDDIHILIYNNRIEILSPGKLPGYVNVENILDARYSRNPKIVRTLNRYPDPPNKDMGEGLNTTFQKMKEFGLKKPEIIEDGNYVKVTLPHSPLASAMEIILEYLKFNSQISNYQARELTGIRSENQMKNEFYKLRDQGLLERVPGLEGPKAAWRLTNN